MKEENATSIEFFRAFRRVADLINGVIFHGKQIVRECDLQEQNPVLHDISKKDNRVSAVENTLDLSVMVTVGKAKFLLMLQGQTIEHYVMPVRASHERGTDYYNQWKKLQKMHNEARDLMKGEEYLSGVKKRDRFYPVIHIVVYFGKKRWKAARKMDDLFLTEIFPEELKKLFTEKPLLIFEMRHFSNEEWFQTDLRQVCGFLKRTNDRMKLKTYIEENQEVFSNLPEDAYDFLTVMAGIRNLRLIKQEVQSKGGGFDMCKAIKEMLRVSRQEGEQEGRLEGRQEGRLEGRQEGRLEGRQEGRLEGQDEMATLSEKLILADRVSELLKASIDREYRNKLLAEFGLA